MATLNLPLGVGKERTLCCRVVCLYVLGWVFLRFLDFFSLGLGGPVGGFWGWFGCFLGAFIVLRRLLMGVSIVWWRYYYAC